MHVLIFLTSTNHYIPLLLKVQIQPGNLLMYANIITINIIAINIISSRSLVVLRGNAHKSTPTNKDPRVFTTGFQLVADPAARSSDADHGELISTVRSTWCWFGIEAG